METSANYVTINPIKLLSGLSKVVIKATTGNLAEALSDTPEIIDAIDVSSSFGKRIESLLTRTLERALCATVRDHVRDDLELADRVRAASFMGMEGRADLAIDEAFFKNPIKSSATKALIENAQLWLEATEFKKLDIDNIIARLPTIVARSLHDEWRSNPKYYSELAASSASPFQGAALFEDEWAWYRSYLISAADEAVFDETFGLRQIYVPARSFSVIDPDKAEPQDFDNADSISSNEASRKLGWLSEEICTWINCGQKDSYVKLIAGGPGSGKSSFAKILAADLALSSHFVLFVPLHQVDIDLGVSPALEQFFQETGHFSSDPLSQQYQTAVILILDGLDEIQMQGKAAQDAAQSFVNDVLRYLDRRNTHARAAVCLITGRDIAIQAAEGAFRGEGAVLHVVPYKIPEEERRHYIDKQNLVALDQRDQWWKQYGNLTGKAFTKSPPEIQKGELDEVTSQPLLNYLVALSFNRGMRLDETTNINMVYEDLLKAVYDRGWARNSHPATQGVSYESFVRLLEEVALAVWHGAGRTTTLSEVEDHCKQSRVGKFLPSFEGSVSSGVSSLLLAFYFRQKGRRANGEKTFEFTHKSFAEYLTSLRIVRLVSTISKQMDDYLADADEGVSEEEALYRWLVVCGPTPLDAYLLQFLLREAAARDVKSLVKWQAHLGALLSNALNFGWPVNKVEGLTFVEAQVRARNGEETLLACLNAVARVTGTISKVDWNGSTGLGGMIKRLQGQRQGPSNKPVMMCLSHLNADGQCLDLADLYGADMSFTRFGSAELNYAIFMAANLSGADFTSARLGFCNMSTANLRGTRFSLRGVFRLRDRPALDIQFDEEDRISEQRRLGSSTVPRRRNKAGDLSSLLINKEAIFVDEDGAVLSVEQVQSYLNQGRAVQ